ncbi:MAG: hypothetical protein ABIH36_01780 [bacterium]
MKILNSKLKINMRPLFKTSLSILIAALIIGLAAWFMFKDFAAPGSHKSEPADFGVEEIHEMGTVPEKPINEKYSYRDFTHQSFSDVPAAEFNDTTIIGTSFYQENDPYKKIFPDDIKGVIFKRCNLDNVYIPEGNIIEGGTHKQLQLQNDLDEWLVDRDLNPIEPMNKEERLAAGVSINPQDIPRHKFTPGERAAFEEKLLPQPSQEQLEELEKLLNQEP